MVLHKVEGCMAFSLNADGKEVGDMTHEERLKVIDGLYEWMKKHADDQLDFVLQAMIPYCGEYKCLVDEPCECCGDTVDEYFLDLDN